MGNAVGLDQRWWTVIPGHTEAQAARLTLNSLILLTSRSGAAASALKHDKFYFPPCPRRYGLHPEAAHGAAWESSVWNDV